MTKKSKNKKRRLEGPQARWKKISYFFKYTKTTKFNSLRKFLLLQYADASKWVVEGSGKELSPVEAT